MLQHIPRSHSPAPLQPHTPMQRHPLHPTIIHPPVQNIIVIKHHIALLHLHSNLPLHPGLVLPHVPLLFRARSSMAPRHHNQTRVRVQSHVPLSMESGFAQTREFFFGGRGRWDVVAVPAQLEVMVGTDEEVEELEDERGGRAVGEEGEDAGEHRGGRSRSG
ncbi:hypothetical protein ACMFMF_011912 [Clarireedia jacksonii]